MLNSKDVSTASILLFSNTTRQFPPSGHPSLLSMLSSFVTLGPDNVVWKTNISNKSVYILLNSHMMTTEVVAERKWSIGKL